MVFTFAEIIDMVIVVLAVGFIFQGYFTPPVKVDKNYDPIKALTQKKRNEFWTSAALVAPAIILHEFGHKFTALAFGTEATFHAAYTFLALGILFKFIKFPLIFVPAYVSFSANVTPVAHATIAVMGPLVNAALWLIPLALIKAKQIPLKYLHLTGTFAKINMFLFFFNMLPIPPFDGYWFFTNLIEILF